MDDGFDIYRHPRRRLPLFQALLSISCLCVSLAVVRWKVLGDPDNDIAAIRVIWAVFGAGVFGLGVGSLCDEHELGALIGFLVASALAALLWIAGRLVVG